MENTYEIMLAMYLMDSKYNHVKYRQMEDDKCTEQCLQGSRIYIFSVFKSPRASFNLLYVHAQEDTFKESQYGKAQYPCCVL